ncbi:hypothetical protein pb186bvf_002000 [Paramecium bursaria]
MHPIMKIIRTLYESGISQIINTDLYNLLLHILFSISYQIGNIIFNIDRSELLQSTLKSGLLGQVLILQIVENSIISLPVDYTSQYQQFNQLTCPGLSSGECGKAQGIITILQTAIILPLSYKVLMIFIIGCILCQGQNYGCLRCILVFWFLVYSSVTIILFIGAGQLGSFSDSNINVNSQLIGIYVALGIITFFKMIAVFFLNKEIKLHISSLAIQVSQQPQQIMMSNLQGNFNYQQAYIIQPQVVNQGGPIQYVVIMPQNQNQQFYGQQQMNIPEMKEVDLN